MEIPHGLSFPALLVLAAAAVPSALAWGPEGHQAVGGLALDHMQDQQRTALEQIVGTGDKGKITAWCNWPDDYRETEQGKWSTPLHYINMVPGEDHYQRERDCADGMCVTEAIRKYAAELGDVALPDDTRREAYGFLCHFVGDLSQPLHAGFGADRGGNEFKITYRGAASDLHTFWDHDLIEQHTDSWTELYDIVHAMPFKVDDRPWNPEEVIHWTNRSHETAATCVYPEDHAISEEFARESWNRIQRQLVIGGVHLARVLNTVLALPATSGTGE